MWTVCVHVRDGPIVAHLTRGSERKQNAPHLLRGIMDGGEGWTPWRLWNHHGRPVEHSRGNREAEGSGGLQIDG